MGSSLGISGFLSVLEPVLSFSFFPASDPDSSDWSFGVTVGSEFSLLFLASVFSSTLLESSLLWSPWELEGGGSFDSNDSHQNSWLFHYSYQKYLFSCKKQRLMA
nr:hypothetical protein [Mycoplasmopsis agalactiae]